MTYALGPNFINEVTAALAALSPPTVPSALGLAWDWSAGTINYGSATAPQIAAINAAKAAHVPARPDPNIAAPELLTGGLALTSTGTGALDGTYPCDPASRQLIIGEQLCLQVTGKFTNGQTTRPWYDSAGASHTFDAAHFTAFAEAVGQFVDAVLAAQAASMPSGVSWAPPSNAYTIA